MNRKFHLILKLLLISSFIFSVQNVSAQGDLLIMPKRLVFDGTQRSQEINLANTGKDTAIYAISFINYRMTEAGNFEQIETPDEGQRFATDFLRYFPRRVTLAPNEAQTIRVQLTRTGNLEEGEYRSHMYFRAVDAQVGLGEEDTQNTDGISIQIKTVFGISIPVILCHGQSTTQVNLSDLELKISENKPILSFVINRSGNMSVYGDLKVEYISPSGEIIQVGLIKGVSVYTPNRKRQIKMELKDSGIDLSIGKLIISYLSNNERVFTTAQLTL